MTNPSVALMEIQAVQRTYEKPTSLMLTLNAVSEENIEVIENEKIIGTVLDTNTVKHIDSDTEALAPYLYLKSLPSKGVRNLLIDAINVWCNVDESKANIIKEVVDMIHTASLLADDVEDCSKLRRGMPTAHMVFGVPQAVNSSTYTMLQAMSKAETMLDGASISIILRGVSQMFIGQSKDLSSTHLLECPTIAEYNNMVDQKTGALFQIAHDLMEAQSNQSSTPNIKKLTLLLGRYFQIRDDYMNLTSSDYANQKGWGEDLDEGKYSFPLVHCIHILQSEKSKRITVQLELRNILVTSARSPEYGMTTPMKRRVLDILNSSNSMEFTRGTLSKLESQIRQELTAVEEATCIVNPIFRSLMDRLAMK